MQEIKNILDAYAQALKIGKRTALATVVEVEGSSYRRPGARMLVSEDGAITGAISGGCLEGDAKRKALLAINQGRNKLAVYDTTQEDGTEIGIQLGCNGIVRILFEPINPKDALNPIELLKTVVNKRRNVVLVTAFYRSAQAQNQPGTVLAYAGSESWMERAFHYMAQARADAAQAMKREESFFRDYDTADETMTHFAECIRPPVSLMIFGAGNDAMPLVDIAHGTGWHVTVIDGRPTHATGQRFARADEILVAKPQVAVAELGMDADTALMLMTHNYPYDLAILREAVSRDCFYIGILGPKRKLEQMLEDLAREGLTPSHAQRERIFGPAGLDIGAETAAEIALSVAAEIKAVLAQREGMPLRRKNGFIHKRVTAHAG